MSFIAGDILIRMAADVASLRSDMENAKSTVGSAVNVMKSAAVALAGAFSAQMFVGWIRGAIDAADEMSKLSMKTGIAMEDIAGLELAFRLGGAEGGAFGASMAKLAKNVVEGGDAFKLLGIETRNTDGTVRSIKDVLYDTADAFQNTEDGTAKTALAMQLFGKTGAELIPILNSGSDGLREMDDMARKLGLTMDEETGKKAELFNDTMDLVGLSLQGIARQVATQMLPTLSSLAGTIFETVTSGDTLANTAQFLANALKLLYSAGAIGIEVFRTLGTAIGAAGAAVVAVLNGDFRAAADIAKSAATDIKTNWGGTAENIKKVWNDAGGEGVESMAKLTGALRNLKPATDEQAASTKKVADESKKQQEEYEKLIRSIETKTAEMAAELAAGQKLTDGERTALKIRQDMTNGTLKLTDAQREHIEKLLEGMLAQERETASTREATEAKKKYEEGLLRVAEAQGKELEKLREGNAKLEEQNYKLKNGERALADRQIELLKTQAAELRWQAALDDGNAALGAQADALEERARLLDEGRILQEAKDTATEWQKTADSIQNGLTDSLFRAAENGKGFFESLRDGIKGMFNNLVLKPIINAVMKPIASGITSFLGLSGPAGAASGAAGGGGMLDGLSSMLGLGSLAGSASLFGSGVMSGLSAWGAGGSVTGLLGSGSSLFAGGIANGLGAIAGALGPIAIALGAIYAISQATKGETRSGSTYAYNASGGGVSAFDASGMSLRPGEVAFISGPSGGAIGGEAGNTSLVRAISATIGGVNTLLTGLGSSAQIENFWAKVETSSRGRGGVLSGGTLNTGAAFGESGLGSNYAGTLFELGTATTIEGEAALKAFALDLQQVTIQALQAATDIPRTISDMLQGIDAESLTEETVGGLLAAIGETVQGVASLKEAVKSLPMQNLANLSFDAAAALIDLAGGLDVLLGQIQTYIDQYYSTEEKAGLQAQSIAAALRSVGIDTTNLATREEFRALVESRDTATVEGQAQLAALLSVASSFASLTAYLSENSLTLDQLVATSPQTALLTQMLEPQASTATSTEQMATGISTSNTLLETIRDRLDGISATAAAAVESARAASSAAIAAASAASAAASAANSAADTASLAASQPTYTADLGTG